MPDPILQALGLTNVPPALVQKVRKLILTDNFVYTSVLNKLVMEHAPDVLREMHPKSREALRERVGFPDKQGGAIWSFQEGLKDGHPYVHAECAQCGQSQDFVAPRPRQITKHDEATGTLLSLVFEPVKAKQVRAVLDHLVWQHCGRTEGAPREIAIMAEQAFMVGAK